MSKTKDFTEDPFMVQRQRLNNLFGEEYVTSNPVLIAAAVLQDELQALRLEQTQTQTAIGDITSTLQKLLLNELKKR